MGITLGIPERVFHPVNADDEIVPYSELDPRVYLKLATAEGDEIGTISFRLSAHTHPKLSDNFRKLCVGYDAREQIGLSLSYRGTHFHAICPNQGIIAGGDVLYKNGCGGHAADVHPFFEETTASLKFNKKPGALCMLNRTTKSDFFDSQFFVIVDPTRVNYLEDGTVFGYVEEGDFTSVLALNSPNLGLEYLQQILRDYGTSSGSPRKKIVITDSGQY